MSDLQDFEPKRGPGRPPKVRERDESRPGEEPTRRRRREAAGVVGGQRQPIPEQMVADKSYNYRLVNGSPGRVQQLYSEDWDVVAHDGTAVDGAGPAPEASLHVGGTLPDGSAMPVYLMRKPKTLYDEDRKEKEKYNDQIEAQIKAGHVRTEDGGRLGKDAEVYATSVSISGGARRVVTP